MHAGNIFRGEMRFAIAPYGSTGLRRLEPVARRAANETCGRRKMGRTCNCDLLHLALAAQTSGTRRERSPSPFPSSAIVKL
jgi:hypothetical protein